MDAGHTGRFIAELRKGRGWTQAELAQRIGVTDKAVSRWETGKGLPDTSLLQPLAAALEVSVGELLAGERMDAEQRVRRADDQILDALRYSRTMLGRVLDAALLLFGAACFLAPLLTTGTFLSWVMGLFLCGLGTARIVLRRRSVRLRPRTFQLLATASLGAAFVMELLPFGAVLRFADGPDALSPPFYYSFFDPGLIGWAHFTPPLTGLFTVTALISAVFAALRQAKAPSARTTAFLFTSLALLLSVFPILSKWEDPTWLGCTISGVLALSLCLLAFSGTDL